MLFPLTASPPSGLSTLVLPQPVGCARHRRARLWVPAWPDLRYGTIACDEPPHVPDPAALAAPLLLRAPLFAAGPSLPLPGSESIASAALAGAGGGRVENRVRGRWRGSAAQRGAAAGGQSARTRSVRAAEQEPAGCFTLDVEVQGSAASTSLIIVYAWKDPLHFNYVHLSTDTARNNRCTTACSTSTAAIASESATTKGAKPRRRSQVDACADCLQRLKGLVETSIDGRKNPSLRAADFSLGAGRIGLGSFFNTGSFRKFELRPGAC